MQVDPMIIEAHGDVQVVRLTGAAPLDPRHVEQADDRLRALVRSTPTPRIVIALAAVEQLSSLMLSVLIRLRSEVSEKGGQVCLAEVPPRLRTLFDLVKVGDLFETYATTDQAVAALSASPR